MASCRDCIIRRKFGSGITDIMDQIYCGDMNWIDDNPLRTKILQKLLRRKIITHLWWSFVRIKFTKLGLKLHERWFKITCSSNCVAKQFTREWANISKDRFITGSLESLAKDQQFIMLRRKVNNHCMMPEILFERMAGPNLSIERSIWGVKHCYFHKGRRISLDEFEEIYAMHLLETS